MSSSGNLFGVALVMALGMAVPVSSHAALVRIDFEGTNSSPDARDVWGMGSVPNLTGYLIYETSTPASSTTGPTATNYLAAIKELSFAIGTDSSDALIGTRSGEFGSVQVRNAAGGDTISFNQMLLLAADLEGEVPVLVNGGATRTFNSAQLTLTLAGPNTATDNQALNGLETSLDLFSQRRQLAVFLSYTQTGSGTTGPWPAVSYNYNLSPVEVSTVPTPGTVALVLAGLAGLGVTRVHRQPKLAQRVSS